jgi:hypothetical protein
MLDRNSLLLAPGDALGQLDLSGLWVEGDGQVLRRVLDAVSDEAVLRLVEIGGAHLADHGADRSPRPELEHVDVA